MREGGRKDMNKDKNFVYFVTNLIFCLHINVKEEVKSQDKQSLYPWAYPWAFFL